MGKYLLKTYVGTKRFGGVIDITDPCYDKDVWCRMNNVEIVSGKYDCIIWEKDEGEWGMRVAIIGIYLNGVVPLQKTMEYIGEICVDAGLAGFFENKPDYSDEEWQDFCDAIGYDNAHIYPEGFCSSSGFGDGEYEVFAFKNDDGKIAALEIHFM